MNRVGLLNTSVHNYSMSEVIGEICSLIEIGSSSYLVEVNVDVVVKMEEDNLLKEVVDNATISLVDGKPLIWVSKWYSKPIKEKISGSDLVPQLLKVSQEKGYSVFLLGGKEEVSNKAVENIKKDYPGLNVVGNYSPYFGFESDKEENAKIIKMISEVSPDILIVCFGCPKQEKWVFSNYKDCGAKISICAGGTIDFLSGNISRAPKWMSNCGLEWFYRFLQEPKRLFKRYFIDDMQILKLVWKYR